MKQRVEMIFCCNLYASHAVKWAKLILIPDHSGSQAHLQRVKLFFWKRLLFLSKRVLERLFCCSISSAVSSVGDSGSAGTTAHVLKKHVLCASFYKCQRCQTTRAPSLSWTCVCGWDKLLLFEFYIFFSPRLIWQYKAIRHSVRYKCCSLIYTGA